MSASNTTTKILVSLLLFSESEDLYFILDQTFVTLPYLTLKKQDLFPAIPSSVLIPSKEIISVEDVLSVTPTQDSNFEFKLFLDNKEISRTTEFIQNKTIKNLISPIENKELVQYIFAPTTEIVEGNSFIEKHFYFLLSLLLGSIFVMLYFIYSKTRMLL